ncbi:MAG: hypothetical protein HND44_19135 [Chloroflexi bacterium]|nr:hypothetical protein [Ardenticatenaceae bacterium]NOG36661.1 hypothetical protein [Chloroflexota bacterium]GIK57126.1 MAG: hypothetical protein BroJett015_27890 [Chloroflexota bacterium]
MQTFWQLYFQASLHALWAKVTGQNTNLESLHEKNNERSNGLAILNLPRASD